MATKKSTRRETARRANVVSASRLNQIIDRVASNAAIKSVATFEKGVIFKPGSLVGLILRKDIPLAEAQGLATQISSGVKRSAGSLGIKALKPAVLVVDKKILVGFIDPKQFDISLGR